MSLVGTRPPTVDEWEKYELHHRSRMSTKPGITGMWQVSFIIGFFIIYATMGFSDSLFDGLLRIVVGLLFVVSIILGANQREKINP